MTASVRLHHGDNREVLRQMIADGEFVESVVTDPPYFLESVVKRFGKAGSAPAKFGTDGAFARQSKDLVGKRWDGVEDDGTRISFDSAFWSLIYQVLLPGGYVLAFSSARTGHRQAIAMEDAGFVMHPMKGWLFGSGLAKPHPADKSLDRLLGPDSLERQQWAGWAYGAQAMKPALEPIYFAQKPFSEKNGALNLIKHGVGSINIGACKVPRDAGDPGHPANLLHDGSDEVVAMFPSSATGSAARFFNSFPTPRDSLHSGTYEEHESEPYYVASTPPVLYSAKAGQVERRRAGKHPTLKPEALMRWLCRLVTPPGGTVLDPFAGSGTTGSAALAEGFSAILIEREDEYAADIRRRLGLAVPVLPSEFDDLLGGDIPELESLLG